MFVFLALIALTLGANPASIVRLPGVVPGAACLDGSAPAYYFAPGTGTGVDKWFIFHQGGGWCTSLEDCYGRSQTPLGSSTSYKNTMDLGDGYFSNKIAVNPVMHNWNKVYLPYCDGASFSGNNATVQNYQGHKVYYRGFLNLQAVQIDLAAHRGLEKATNVIISGCSAGGLATYLHVDWWADRIRHANVKGMPDSGFFLDWNAPGSGPKYANDMRWVFEAQAAKGGVNQRCVEHYKSSEYNCFFAEHTAPHIKSPIFPLQSQYDSWQTANILGSKDAHEINRFGAELIKRFTTNVLKSHHRNGVFLDSCHHHCGQWNNIIIHGNNSAAALKQWYNHDHGVFIQLENYPCDACCHPKAQFDSVFIEF